MLAVAVLGVAYFMGVLRPTGLWGRDRALEEREQQDKTAQKWLDEDGK
jgi:hypothetical protein